MSNQLMDASISSLKSRVADILNEAYIGSSCSRLEGFKFSSHYCTSSAALLYIEYVGTSMTEHHKDMIAKMATALNHNNVPSRVLYDQIVEVKVLKGRG